MVMSFFRKGPTGLEHIVSQSIGMLGDARHSFDLATLALLTETTAKAVEDDIRATDRKINQTEVELRSELVVHVSVQGTADIGSVLGMILLIKKIERIGDQAGNILDLVEAGVSLAGRPDTDAMLAELSVISAMFAEVAELVHDHDDDRFADLERRGKAMLDEHQKKIEGYLLSERPGNEVVPRAIYYRYLKRIVANLLGIVRAASDPLPDLRDESDDLDDD